MVKLSFGTGNTPSGSNVAVAPKSATRITFSGISTPGNTTVTTSGALPVPTGFNLGLTPTYYDISTTATYNPPTQVCLTYMIRHDIVT